MNRRMIALVVAVAAALLVFGAWRYATAVQGGDLPQGSVAPASR